MKRYKRLYVVLAVLLAACIATFALSRYKAQKEQIQTSGETILSISADEVESLSWDKSARSGLKPAERSSWRSTVTRSRPSPGPMRGRPCRFTGMGTGSMMEMRRSPWTEKR